MPWRASERHMAVGHTGTGRAPARRRDPAEAPAALFMASAGDHLVGRKWHIVGRAGGVCVWGGQSWNTSGTKCW